MATQRKECKGRNTLAQYMLADMLVYLGVCANTLPGSLMMSQKVLRDDDKYKMRNRESCQFALVPCGELFKSCMLRYDMIISRSYDNVVLY